MLMVLLLGLCDECKHRHGAVVGLPVHWQNGNTQLGEREREIGYKRMHATRGGKEGHSGE